MDYPTHQAPQPDVDMPRYSDGPCCGYPHECGVLCPEYTTVVPASQPPRLPGDPASTEGIKRDAGKAPMSLIPRSALLAEANVLGFGAAKYAADNWRKGMAWRRLGDAAMRHLTAWLDGEDYDAESGQSHLAHLRCCAGFLIEYQARGLGTDDRWHGVAQ